jgi:hypothetical protein
MSTTVTDHQTPGNRPGLPRSAYGKADGQPRPAARPATGTGPQSPWNAHLRALIGQPVTVFSYGPANLVEYSGRLVAVDLNHLNCAIETASGEVLTFKNVHHISSLAPVGGCKVGA